MNETEPQSPNATRLPCPYKAFPDSSYWKRAVADVAPAEFDPVLEAPFVIGTDDRVATAGSCFAQHIARHLAQSGFRYHVAEQAPASIHPAVARRYNYGTFSARYGNLYTTRQLRQLVDRALGRFVPAEPFWPERGGWVDPFRPQIQPIPFASVREAELDRQQHLKSVRTMLAEMDVFVFTLGLTETWESVADGAVFPVCPGCGSGSFDPQRYRFVNLDYEQVRDDLLHALRTIRKVNAKCRFILTVSPVPLIATAEKRHVLVATSYSKSVLRAAAEAVSRSVDACAYFPSFEIITGPQAGARYFEPDLRSVREEGVEHVMRVFFRHFTVAPAVKRETAPAAGVHGRSESMDVVCDEEILDRI